LIPEAQLAISLKTPAERATERLQATP
jgi:hypothetical protein